MKNYFTRAFDNISAMLGAQAEASAPTAVLQVWLPQEVLKEPRVTLRRGCLSELQTISVE